jgi:ferrous iron transport protein B
MTNKKYNLDSIKVGKTVRVVRVNGSGGFRQRLMEMGFIKGAEVTVIKNAPLHDPVEYMILGTHISLRHSEAAKVEITNDELENDVETEFNGTIETYEEESLPNDNTIRVALVGNPNCGKTSLFNFATGSREKVGNYGGVTVDCKVGEFKYKDKTIQFIDLPGTYSLTEYSPEEMYVRTYLRDNHPDAILNIVDAGNLERNMYLTTQIMDMNIPMVVALNMWDEFKKSGDTLDREALGRLLGTPIVPVIAKDGSGINDILSAIVNVFEDPSSIHKNVNYGATIENSITQLSSLFPTSNRYILLKLLENDKHALALVEHEDNAAAIKENAAALRDEIEKEYNDDISSIISDLKYGFVRGALAEVYTKQQDDNKRLGFALDVVLTNRWLGLPILIVMMWLVFEATFTIGAYPQGWIESLVDWFGGWVGSVMPNGALRDLLVDGIISGVGGVLVFLPNILILFLFISILEDSGYMARAAFIVDRVMHKIGLHGKSFIPYLIGFGCGVPAIMATRTLENRRDRLITILTIPFMSCSARLPTYLLFVSAFFVANQGLILMSLYLIGILVAALTSILLNKTILKHDSSQFVMELPPYRVPTARNSMIHMWSKGSQYLQKMATVILVASIIVWALGYFPHDDKSTPQQQIENSYMGHVGKTIEPAFRPLGFNWQMGVSLLTGAAAKEIVVSSMGILYTGERGVNEESASLKQKLQTATDTNGNKIFTPIVAYTFMLFVLLYFPCIAALTAIKREAGMKWTLFTIAYTTLVAWIISFVFYQVASLI